MKLPLISIVTPSFNQAQYIKATIDSVLSQEYPHIEYIVIDGESTDGTIEILKSYGKRLKWISEPDGGQADAINKGLRKCHGEILAYLNSDDILMPGALKAVGEYYAQNPSCNWLTGDYRVIGTKGEELKRDNWLVSSYKRLLLNHYSQTLLRITDNMFPQPSTFWSRASYLKIGDFNKNLHYVMDYDYWLRLSKLYTPHYLRVTLSGFRAQPESKSETSRRSLISEATQVLRSHGATHLEIMIHNLHSVGIRLIYRILRIF